MRLLLCLLLILLLLVAACQQRSTKTGTPAAGQPQPTGTSAADTGTSSGSAPDDTAAGGAESQANTASAEGLGAPRQVIIIYSGDTLSIPEINSDYKPPQGGLCALAATIADYETQIVDYNRKRVENAGGDPSAVRADFKAGLLGDNPYLLLDYGGWERPNDPYGELFVELQFRLYRDLHYFAVGGKLYEQLDPERWQKYLGLRDAPALLVSAGEARAPALSIRPLATRELQGQLWGVVMAPLPRVEGDPSTRIRKFVEAAAGELERADCGFGVLLCAGGPGTLYDELAGDARFDVVIGCKPGKAVDEGFGEMPAAGPLMLPELQGGARQLGVCHIIYPRDGEQPEAFHFLRLTCADDGSQPFPYRQQVEAARLKHGELMVAWRAEQLKQQHAAGR